MTDLDSAAIAAMGIPCAISETGPLQNRPDTPVAACGEPAIALISFACVHEHYDTPNACNGCCAKIEFCAEELVCPRCHYGPEPHECLQRVTIAWFDGSPVTVVQEGRP